MLEKILKWLGFNKPSTVVIDKREHKLETLSTKPVISKKVIQGKPYIGKHTEESLGELTKGQLKTLGESQLQVKFNAGDRKAEMIMRILTAQGV